MCFRLNEILVKAKLENGSFVLWELVCREVLPAAKHEGTFGDDENYLCFNWDDNYIALVYAKTVQLNQ